MLFCFIKTYFCILLMNRFVIGYSLRGVKTQSITTQIFSKKNDKKGFYTHNTHNIYLPKTDNQKKYLDFMNNPNVSVIVGVGPSGSGKTLLACCSAVQSLKNGVIDKIVITRPLITVDDEDVGFLPGNLMSKMEVWAKPIMDILKDFYNEKEIETMVRNDVIEIAPLAYMRGRTFKNTFIIADEMQNSSPKQMIMVSTRLGENSKLVITGDLEQSDRSEDNGLADLMKKIGDIHFQNVDDNDDMVEDKYQIKMVEMDAVDIQRSPIVNKMIHLYRTKHSIIQKYNTNNDNDNKKINKDFGIEFGNSDCALIPLNRLPKRDYIL